MLTRTALILPVIRGVDRRSASLDSRLGAWSYEPAARRLPRADRRESTGARAGNAVLGRAFLVQAMRLRRQGFEGLLAHRLKQRGIRQERIARFVAALAHAFTRE